MGNFISDQLTKVLNQKMQGIGQVDQLTIENDAVKATLTLNGETEPLQLEVLGIRWATKDGKLNIYFESARASKVWMQGLINALTANTGRCISLPDKLSLAPVKILFRKA